MGTNHDACAHKLDEVATKAAKRLRCINDSVQMLEDALHALRSGKVHIVDDHIDRVLTDLRKHQ